MRNSVFASRMSSVPLSASKNWANSYMKRFIPIIFLWLASASCLADVSESAADIAPNSVMTAVAEAEQGPEQPVFRLKDELESRGEANSSNGVGSMVVGLAAVLGIIFLLAWISKRFNIGTPGGSSNMRMISAMSVGQKEKIILVEVEGEKLLLGVTPHQISRLKEFGKARDPAITATPPKETETNVPKTDFSERMSKLLKAGVSGNE
ncbi:MAG: flagellar biosynthetic protein FliO [Pseudomonadales bacterium]|nr:flagellar biosynthetic protein FliO [Pseudomonadales bacterium]